MFILDDGENTPRTVGLNNKALPNARKVSNVVHCNTEGKEEQSTSLTLHVMGFGQFLDHDIARTPEQDGKYAYYFLSFLRIDTHTHNCAN